jgi:hypothetical protein
MTNILELAYLMEFFRPSFDKKFARSFREIWVEEKYCCLCER